MSLLLRLALTPVLVAWLSFAFSKALVVTSQFSVEHSVVIYLLPLAGMFLTWWNATPQRQLPKLHELDLHITNQKPTNPWSFLYVFLWTQLSHLIGASVGRESPATVMGLSAAKMLKGKIANQMSYWSTHYWTEVFLRAGIAAGFSAVFGVPIAGTVFAISLSPLWRWPLLTLVICTLSSFVAFEVAHYLQIPHSSYPQLTDWPNSPLGIFFLWLCVFLFGGFYLQAKEYLAKALLKIKSPLWRGFAVGFSLQVAIMILGLTYVSMSLDVLNLSFSQANDLFFFLGKGFVTLLSQLANFAGGEVTPLMTTASTLGNTIVQFWQLPLSFAWSGAIAVVTFLTLLLDAPLAMTFLGCELFGWQGFFVFAITAYLTYVFKIFLWKKTSQRSPSKQLKN